VYQKLCSQWRAVRSGLQTVNEVINDREIYCVCYVFYICLCVIYVAYVVVIVCVVYVVYVV
jgi:hypothetical protein